MAHFYKSSLPRVIVASDPGLTYVLHLYIKHTREKFWELATQCLIVLVLLDCK